MTQVTARMLPSFIRSLLQLGNAAFDVQEAMLGETINQFNQSIHILCLWDSSGESTDINWENSVH